MNGSRRSDVPIIFTRSDDAQNERLYPYKATLFRVSDVQKKRHCPGGAILFGRRYFVERGLLNWKDSSRTALTAALASILGADRTLPTMSKATIIYKRGRDSRKMRKFLSSPLDRKIRRDSCKGRLLLIIPIEWKIGENLIQWLLSHDKQLDASLVLDGVVVDMSVRSYLFHCFESY